MPKFEIVDEAGEKSFGSFRSDCCPRIGEVINFQEIMKSRSQSWEKKFELEVVRVQHNIVSEVANSDTTHLMKLYCKQILI